MLKNPNNYSPLYIKCYLCKIKGHIATDCEFFSLIKSKNTRFKLTDLGWSQNDIKQKQDDIVN